MELFFASGNEHKKKEMTKLFPSYTIRLPKEFGVDFDPIEDGTTFAANSLIKAETLYKLVQKPVIADDSGIEVDILNGRPGIYSARYAGKDDPFGLYQEKKLSSKERNALLIEEVIDRIKDSQQPVTCRFVCAMTLYINKKTFLTVQETIEGQLITDITKAQGQNGFGYDPIVFIPEYNKTMAELTEDEKNAISHRGKCAKKINLFLKNL
ncbi:MAG: RdgB/HAM1 family non-canonical purine NTP pyrophosphatase [Spirochaetaceae bacterium]|nr:RdgB/HAM1 family non-canonical purine NTP pyrophosphatase [Spirochaetaceae bacterium]